MLISSEKHLKEIKHTEGQPQVQEESFSFPASSLSGLLAAAQQVTWALDWESQLARSSHRGFTHTVSPSHHVWPGNNPSAPHLLSCTSDKEEIRPSHPAHPCPMVQPVGVPSSQDIN